MSTRPYSLDLRKKVINYLEQGGIQKTASEIFDLHKNTVNRWWMRYKQEGDCAARTRLGYKSKVDMRGLEFFVKTNPNTKLSEVGSRFGISGVHASRLLKQMGFSYKKKPSPMWKRTKESETSMRSS
jgi:transposase